MIFKELTLKVRKDGIINTLEKSHLLLTNPLTSNYNFQNYQRFKQDMQKQKSCLNFKIMRYPENMYAFAIWQQLMYTEFLGILEEDEGNDEDVLWGKQHDVYIVYIPP